MAEVLGLGLLTKAFDRKMIDSVLAATGRREQRVRRLPAHEVVYLVLGLALHPDESYAEVSSRMAKTIAQFQGSGSPAPAPTVGAITSARTRLGPDPMMALFNRAALPLAEPGHPQSFMTDHRIVWLHCRLLNVADSPANAAAFGYQKPPPNPLASAFPQVRIVTLTEAGTHATIGAAVGPCASGDRELAAQTCRSYLRRGMVATAAREFYSPEMWDAALSTGAALLWSVDDAVTLPVLTPLPDGTYLSELAPIGGQEGRPPHRVRVLHYTVSTDPAAPLLRLISSQLSPDEASAEQLLEAFSTHPEAAQAFAEFDAQHAPAPRPLRSRTPVLVLQEVWAQMLCHYAIRSFITEAAVQFGPLTVSADEGSRLTLVARSSDNT